MRKCKNCGIDRPVKNIKKQKSDFCRNCGLKKSMEKRSKNQKWRENLSVALSGKPKSEKHKIALHKKHKMSKKKDSSCNNYREDTKNSWSINKRNTLERDGKKCRHCGTTIGLQVHHMNPFKKSKNNDINNLITLCVKCHRRAEESRSPVSQKNKICGVVLAGGRGTRLFPTTFFHNKHELPVGPVPMIFHPIKILRSLRVTEILIILDREGSRKIIQMLGDGSEFGLNFTYKVQNDSGGIAEALSLAEDFVQKRIVYVILADNIFEMNEFSRPIKFWTTGCVFLKEVNNPKDYGIAELKKKYVIRVKEKPDNPKTNLAVTGLYVYRPEIFKILKRFNPSKRGEMEISDLNDYLAKLKKLSFKKIKGEWMDAGYSTEGYIDANIRVLQWMKEGKK